MVVEADYWRAVAEGLRRAGNCRVVPVEVALPWVDEEEVDLREPHGSAEVQRHRVVEG